LAEVLIAKREMVEEVSYCFDSQPFKPVGVSFPHIRKFSYRIGKFKVHRKMNGRNEESTRLIEAIITIIVQSFCFL